MKFVNGASKICARRFEGSDAANEPGSMDHFDAMALIFNSLEKMGAAHLFRGFVFPELPSLERLPEAWALDL